MDSLIDQDATTQLAALSATPRSPRAGCRLWNC